MLLDLKGPKTVLTTATMASHEPFCSEIVFRVHLSLSEILAPKTKNSRFLKAFNQTVLQGIKKSFEVVHLDAKVY